MEMDQGIYFIRYPNLLQLLVRLLSSSYLMFFVLERGEFLVVVDNEDRENEGDLIIAGQDLTPEKAAFMIRYTRYSLKHRFHNFIFVAGSFALQLREKF